MKGLVAVLLTAVIFTGCTAFRKMGMVMSSNPYENDPTSVKLGEIVYKANCVECHGPSGKGDGKQAQFLAKKPADLPTIAKKKSAKSFAASTKYGKGDNMPAFKDKLSEAEVWHVANFIDSWGGEGE